MWKIEIENSELIVEMLSVWDISVKFEFSLKIWVKLL